MTNIKTDKTFADAKDEIMKNIDEFRSDLDKGTSDPDSFMTLSEIEAKWRQLNNSTSKIYSDMVAAYLSDLDEKEIIASKKESTERKE